ncbi:MAG: hypothetical protein ACK4UO_13820 [Pseudolabrys sp.]
MADSPLVIRRRTLKLAEPYVLAQGGVVYGHNALHEAFFQTFRVALSLERPDKFAADLRFYDHALAIWHTSQSDKQQRDMALAAMSTLPCQTVNLKPAIARLDWARRRADKFAEWRNIVAHNPIMFTMVPKGRMMEAQAIFGGYITRKTSRDRLAKVSGLRFWRQLRDDLLNLSEYVRRVNGHVLFLHAKKGGVDLLGAPKTWPDRPRLKCPPLIHQIEDSLGRASPTRSSRVRRRASRKSPSQ